MTDLIPYLLVGTLAVLLIAGIVMYVKLLKEPWDEWDEISQDIDTSSDKKD